jgi:hypothetical protein
VDLRVRDRPADHRTAEAGSDLADSGVHRAFGRSIEVEEANLLRTRHDSPGLGVDRFPGYQNLPERQPGRSSNPAARSGPQGTWLRRVDVNRFAHEEGQQRLGVEPDVFRHDAERVSLEQLKDLLDGGVKSKGTVEADPQR